MSNRRQHSAVFQQALALYHDWDLDGSTKLFSQIAAGPKNKDDGFYGLGLVCLQQKHLKEAEKNFEQCREINPSQNNATYYLGFIAHLRGEYLRAHELYEHVLSDNPEHAAAKYQYHRNIRALVAKAKFLHRNGKIPQSRRLFRTLITTDDYKAAGYYGLGVINYLAADLDEAGTDFAKAVRLHPKHANAYYYLGKIAQVHKDAGEVDRNFKQALKINPKHAAANREVRRKTVVRIPTQERVRAEPRPKVASGKPKTGFSLPANRRPFLSAYAGPIIFGLLLAFICFLLVTGSGRRAGPAFRDYVSWAGFFVFVFTVLYVVRVRRTVFNFHTNGMLSIERGVFGSSVKNYDLRYLARVEPQQTLLNRLTHDGSLLLTLRVPAQRGGFVITTLKLRGLAKWNELKTLGVYLNSLLQGASS